MKIGIIGCGYLGARAAQIWKAKGLSIIATTRNSERLDILSKVSTKSVVIKNADEESLAPIVDECDVIVVTIAADSPEEYENAYLNTAIAFRQIASQTDKPKQLIYTSSTSVYGENHGLWVDEKSPLLNKSGQGKILIETESTYLSLKEFGWTVCILRLSELYGPGRELSKRVERKNDQVLSGDGTQYTNMIHRDDAALALDYALHHHLEGIYNIADDEHPSRKDLYNAVSHKFGLPIVNWDPEHSPLHSGNKRVSNHKIKAEGFALHHPHRILD